MIKIINSNVKILVVSNEALSKSTSNGRTLSNFLINIPQEQIAQFYLHGVPDVSICKKHYRVSDKDVLNAFLFRKKKLENNVSANDTASPKASGTKRNCRNLVIRDLVWGSYRWWDKSFNNFLEEVKPTVVLFQAGDSPFLFLATIRIAKKFNIPIIMYNSEGYVLKKKLYSKANEKSLWHKILQKSLRSAYKKMMDNVSYCIYITEYLEECYQEKYPHKGKSKALYTTTEMRDCSKLDKEDEIFNLVYCGNLGVGRVPALCEVAECLQNVDSNAKLVIYGKFVTEEDERLLCAYNNVDFRGLIPYGEVPKAIAHASMVLHCENKERLENLKHAFSTKIADCLACGKPFIVFADKEYPFVQYLAQNDAAHIAGTKEELTGILEGCIKNSDLRSKTINNALNLAKKNHNADKNAEDFCRIINNL